MCRISALEKRKAKNRTQKSKNIGKYFLLFCVLYSKINSKLKSRKVVLVWRLRLILKKQELIRKTL